MKSNFALLLMLLFPLSGIKAQQPINVYEDSLKIGDTMLPGLSVTIPEADYDKTLKEWVKELQSRTKSQVVTENNQMSIFGANIRSISSDPVNVYSRLVSLDSMLMLYASFELKKDQYVERDLDESVFNKAQNFLKEFSKTQYLSVARDQVNAEEKKLHDLQKELSSLENEKSRMRKSISSANSNISSDNENISAGNAELTTVNAALAEQNAQLATMEEGPARKELEDQVKDLEKRKRKAEHSIKSSERKIRKADSNIDKATGEIPRNERIQEKLKEQIAEQEAVYQKFADKLKRIKAY